MRNVKKNNFLFKEGDAGLIFDLVEVQHDEMLGNRSALLTVTFLFLVRFRPLGHLQ